MRSVKKRSQLPFGWVCFSNRRAMRRRKQGKETSQLPFGWVCFSNVEIGPSRQSFEAATSQLPFGWVCFSNVRYCVQALWNKTEVSIAFRLGLFL